MSNKAIEDPPVTYVPYYLKLYLVFGDNFFIYLLSFVSFAISFLHEPPIERYVAASLPLPMAHRHRHIISNKHKNH